MYCVLEKQIRSRALIKLVNQLIFFSIKVWSYIIPYHNISKYYYSLFINYLNTEITKKKIKKLHFRKIKFKKKYVPSLLHTNICVCKIL